MKTTLDISNELLVCAKRYAKQAGKPLRAVVEESLQETQARAGEATPYKLQHYAVGTAGAADPLERISWQDLRDEICGHTASSWRSTPAFWCTRIAANLASIRRRPA